VVKFKKIEVFLLQIRGKITAAASSTSVDFGAAFSAWGRSPVVFILECCTPALVR